ncbi:MAG TPA: hypothetical protein VFP37_06950 [Steroidobacteraceae bacterium]|nr:hypothetical protein [Steroidobacteraceae bacterium]
MRKLLRGSGKEIRHIVLEDAATLERPAVRKLLKLAIASASALPDARARRRIVIKAIVAKQRPRRPQA